jgi:hypothetical protein
VIEEVQFSERSRQERGMQYAYHHVSFLMWVKLHKISLAAPTPNKLHKISRNQLGLVTTDVTTHPYIEEIL